MKWFLNFKIGVKLIIGFLIVSSLLGLVGYIGINNMRIINDNIAGIK